MIIVVLIMTRCIAAEPVTGIGTSADVDAALHGRPRCFSPSFTHGGQHLPLPAGMEATGAGEHL